jgi:hypothetical protein
MAETLLDMAELLHPRRNSGRHQKCYFGLVVIGKRKIENGTWILIMLLLS